MAALVAESRVPPAVNHHAPNACLGNTPVQIAGGAIRNCQTIFGQRHG